MSQCGRNGTDILLSPTLEWRGIHPLSLSSAVFRSIENGVTLFRAADNGVSIAVDPYGRVLGRTDHFQAGERVLVAQLPTHGVTTIYSIIGDVVAWLSIAAVVVLTAWAVGKFSADIIGPFVKKCGIMEKVKHQKLIIPGYAAVESGGLEEELPGWEILVGPREGAHIPAYIKTWTP
jgi:hypothetical protein